MQRNHNKVKINSGILHRVIVFFLACKCPCRAGFSVSLALEDPAVRSKIPLIRRATVDERQRLIVTMRRRSQGTNLDWRRQSGGPWRHETRRHGEKDARGEKRRKREKKRGKKENRKNRMRMKLGKTKPAGRR